VLAGEPSTGTFRRVPGKADERRERHGARREAVTLCGDYDISWPLANLGPPLPNLLATAAGDPWVLKQFTVRGRLT
jgi:ribulose-bisphosphate carboxylase large chain